MRRRLTGCGRKGSRGVPSAPSTFTYGEATTIQDYKDWLRSHNLEDLMQQPGGWRDRRKRLHLGKFVFPDRATYLSITNRTELEQNRSAGICLETPYWFKYDIGEPGCQGGKPPCKQANRVRPEGGCGVIPKEIFFDFYYFFPKK